MQSNSSGMAKGMALWLATKGDNQKKMERNIYSRATNLRQFDSQYDATKKKRMKLYSQMYDKVHSPLEALIGPLVVEGMVRVVEHRAMIESSGVVVADEGEKTVERCLAALANMQPSELEGCLAQTTRKFLTWEHRAAGIYAFFHPSIFGKAGDITQRISRAATAIGVSDEAFRTWVSRKEVRCSTYYPKWIGFVEAYTWSTVKKMFDPEWCARWHDIADDSVIEKEALRPYKELIKADTPTFLSKYTPNTTTAGRRSAASRSSSVKTIKVNTCSAGRSDKGRARKHAEIEKFVHDLVQFRWDEGDPISKAEIKSELYLHDDCAKGSVFYNSYLCDSKKSGYSNWIKAALKRGGFSFRCNSVGQTVPDNWRELAEANAEKIRKAMKAANVDIILNADQTFVNFYPEQKKVAAKTGTRRVGGKIKSDTKAGFTFMVTVEMNSSIMVAPFVVYNGTKLKYAKNKKQTLAYKFKDWRNLSKGRTAYVAFQQKHWFDQDITIEFIDFILDVVYPGRKVGMTMDMAPAHRTGLVGEHIKKRTEEGRLAVEFIDGGLTSVLQVCDLTANKQVKALIKEGYLDWRTAFVKAERARLGNKHARVQLKMPIATMTEIVEAAVKKFNDGQKESKSIARTFCSAGQDPYSNCEAEFKAHLDSLAKLPSYSLEEKKIESRRGAQLRDESGVEVEVEVEVDGGT